jgi:hypothetical protein
LQLISISSGGRPTLRGGPHISIEQFSTWLRRFLTAPWTLIASEAWRDRYATAGDLRLQFMDLRKPPRRDPGRLQSVLGDALERLSHAGQGFGELVTSHLRMVVAVDHVAQAYILSSSAWGSTFQDQSRTNGHILACKLIWAATSIRLARDAKRAGRPLNTVAIRDAAWEAQQRFLHQFGDAEEWIAYMQPEGGADGPASGTA